jgi:hypothetical protein
MGNSKSSAATGFFATSFSFSIFVGLLPPPRHGADSRALSRLDEPLPSFQNLAKVRRQFIEET